MKFISIFLLIALCLPNIGVGQNLNCQKEYKLSGSISESYGGQNPEVKCTTFEVAKDSYIRIDVKEFKLIHEYCSNEYLEITANGTGEVVRYCYNNGTTGPITALSNVNITRLIRGKYNTYFKFWDASRLTIDYNIETISCTQKYYIRCSKHICIHQYQICDGVKDCEDGSDEAGCETGLKLISGVNSSRENAIDWLRNQSSASFGWGRNTHRAITALYLAGDAHSIGEDLKEELTVKQLELQTAVAFLRNSSDPLSVSELSMFVNALSATCHNPRKFFGLDLLRILSDQLATSNSPSPGSYLTLCNANWTFSESNVRNLFNLLNEHSEYLFSIDIQAMTVMALTCIKNKMKVFEDVVNSTIIYKETIQKLIRAQEPDGSFGNVYTTALVTQALLSSRQDLVRFNRTLTVMYLMQYQNTSPDFLSTYWILPILNDKNLVDMANVNCSKIRDKNDDITDVTDGKIFQIQYSLYIGDLKDVVHTIYLRVLENSTVYDVMKLAQEVDPKYKFLYKQVDGRMYIYEIAGITNDPEALKFWLFYTGDFNVNGKMYHHTKSPDKFVMRDREHLIMWFKTIHI